MALMFRIALISFATGVMLSVSAPVAAQQVTPSHGIAMHGDLKYGPDFKHYDYVNPNAPKGGDIRLAAIGGYDSFNPFIVKGRSASGIGLLYDSLLTSSADEAFSRYGHIAESVEVPEDRSWIIFTLDADARWHDGKPISVDDVIWSFNTLKAKGAPIYRFYYSNVATAEEVGPRKVKFTFTGGENRELPLIISELTILPKHYWEGRDFSKTTLEPPLGSGAYRIASFEPNRSITYERVPDYWAEDRPTMVGKNNFGTIRYDYYRDGTVAQEAFKASEFDFRSENGSKAWATAYEIPAVKNGLIKKEELPHNRVAGMQGFVFNTRNSLFRDRNVRRALAYAFDFEWSNGALFYGQYTRTRSFFDNSELAATGLPKGRELELLESYRGRIPDEVFTEIYAPPKTDGSGNIRNNLRDALGLLKTAGWNVDTTSRKLVHTSGQAMAFEILLVDPQFERIILPFKQNLERLGVDATVRIVDTAQYQERLNSYDFELVVSSWGQSLSPGNEQRNFWGSAAADRNGTRNLAGLKNPVIDELIEKLISAPDRASLVTATQALDRILQWQHIVVPNWHIPYDRMIYWSKFGRPAITPDSGAQFFSWWIDKEKAEQLEKKSKSGTQ
jgi:microcin C transport system substrate-binding protein